MQSGLCLIGARVLEVAGTTAMKMSEGLSDMGSTYKSISPFLVMAIKV